MRVIFKIAKNELRYLFYSPIAWFVMIIFLVQCAVFYSNQIYDLANWQDIYLKNSPKFNGISSALTFKIFVMGEVFSNVVGNLYLFIPILTMGIINREINNGSSKLLYSSPVRLRQVVLGKYLGIMLYNLLLVAALGIIMIAAAINIKNVDYGMLLSAALGFYLLVCAYSAIGIFMSTLSNYQIVSALSTFIIIFILSRIGDLWQRYDFVRDLTYFLSLQNRTLKMLVGLIVSRDVIYFIVIAAMFVAFTLIKLKAGRETKPWYIKAGRYITVLAIALLIGYVSSRSALTGYLDTTATQRNTIPKEMQQLIKDMGDSTLEVTLYTNLLGDGIEHGLPEARNADYLANMWEPYLRFKPDIVFKYEYFYDNDPKKNDSALYKLYPPGFTLKRIAELSAERIEASLDMFKSPEEMKDHVGLQAENYRVVMQLKYNGRTEFLRTYPPPVPFWPQDINVAAAFKRLLEPSKIPNIYFVTGELERSIYKNGDREYSNHTSNKLGQLALINIGFDVDSLNVAMHDIPANTTAIVLADPKMELDASVQNKLKNYVATGGNIFILGEPGKQHLLNPFLQQLGVQLSNGQLVEPTYDETPDKVQPYATAVASDLYKDLSWIKKLLEAKEDTFRILMPGATAIKYTEDSAFSIKQLLTTVPDKVWLKAGDLVIDSTLPAINLKEGDLKENSFATGVLLTRHINNKEQRIVICSDADFASNIRFAPVYNILMSIYSWTDYNEFPVYMTYRKGKDTLLKINAAGAYAQKIALIWVLPGLLLLTGTILLIRRKRK